MNFQVYNKSGVNLIAFGPSPILRTHEIRITGTNLNQVTGVAFPGGATVEKSSFNKADNEDIYLNVPDESLPGQIKLMVGGEALGWKDPLEEGMETNSSILAWRIPWTEKLGRLHAMRSQKVGQD